MNSTQQYCPNYSLVTSYRSSKLKIVLLFILQLFLVLTFYTLSILTDEYKNMSKSFLKDMDFDITFTDDLNIEIEGQVEISSALSTTLYISDLYGHVYLDTDDDIEHIKNTKRAYKDNYAPLAIMRMPFKEPQLIKPAKLDATQTTKMSVKGKISIPVIPNIIKKVEENLHGELRQFRFNIYPTLIIKIGIIEVQIRRNFTIPYVILQGTFLKIVEPKKHSDSALSEKYNSVFNKVIICAWMNIETMPFNLKGFKFENYYIKFRNTKSFDFDGEVLDFRVISTKNYPKEFKNSQNDFPFIKEDKINMYNLYAAIALRKLPQNDLYTHVTNLLLIENYNTNSKLTHVTVLGRRSSDEWLNVHNRLKFIAYRDLNLNFDIGIN